MPKKSTSKSTKKTKQSTTAVSISDVLDIQNNYVNELETNPEYSLEADPTGELKMTQIQKDFIRHYVNFKSIGTAAELACIDADTAKTLFVAYDTQLEIRRINRALCHRQFASKLISIDEIGGYLSSLLTGDNVPLADQLKTNEKLRVVELLLRLNEMKANSLDDPGKIYNMNVEAQLKQLSVTAIQVLLDTHQKANIEEKNKVISNLDDGSLSLEEKAYLSSLPVEELLKLLNETKNGGNN